MSDPDPVVCIIGAGPAGLVLAHVLQRAGISFVVLERQEAAGLRARTKAGLIEPRSVQLLEPYGLERTILEHGSRNGVCEFRADGEAFVLDYGALTDGHGHYVYPQNELVADWAEALLAAGGRIRFGVRVTGVEQDDVNATVRGVTEATGEGVTIRCAVVACCDGAGSAVATAAGVTTVEVSHPFRWLAVIAAVSPSSPRTIYALHSRGFAGQMRRSATATRYYLEVPATDTLGDWPDERIWGELQERLALAGEQPLGRGDLLERDLLDLRVRVREPMQSRRIFLAGDAAHLVTPAGGKGMNLAIRDAVELAGGLCDRYGPAGTGDRLAGYSTTRLADVWRYQEFSNSMLSLLHAGATPAEQTGAATGEAETPAFAYRLRRARLARLLDDPEFSRWFAQTYAGAID